MKNQVQAIAIDKLIEHQGNPNVMSDAVFGKLVRNIERTGRYEPLVVRPCADRQGCFEILNGHHRAKALAKLGYEAADAVVWNVDDTEAQILLATLNRLCGADRLDKRAAILKSLGERLSSGELGRLLPETACQIDKLMNMKLQDVTMPDAGQNAVEPMVFFVTAEQKQITEKAICMAGENSGGRNRTQMRAKALAAIAKHFIDNKEGDDNE